MRTIKLGLAIMLVVGVAALFTMGAQAGPGGGKGKPTKAPDPTEEPTAEPTACPECTGMYASVVNVNAGRQQGYTYAVCLVQVTDTTGTLVEGALVDVEWGGDVSGTGSGLTVVNGADTFATIYIESGGRCKENNPKCYSCTVTDITKDGYAYDSSLNIQTADADSCDPFSQGCN